MEDARRFGCKLVIGTKVLRIVIGNYDEGGGNDGMASIEPVVGSM